MITYGNYVVSRFLTRSSDVENLSSFSKLLHCQLDCEYLINSNCKRFAQKEQKKSKYYITVLIFIESVSVQVMFTLPRTPLPFDKFNKTNIGNHVPFIQFYFIISNWVRAVFNLTIKMISWQIAQLVVRKWKMKTMVMCWNCVFRILGFAARQTYRGLQKLYGT